MTRDPIDRLRHIGPQPEDLADEDLAPARRRFTELTGVTVDPDPRPEHAVVVLPRSGGGGRRWWLAAAAAAAVVVLAAGLAFASRDDTARTATSSPATGPVRTWAGLIDLVAHQPIESTGSVQYLRWESVNRGVTGTNPDGSPRWTTNPYLTERWITADGRSAEYSGNVLQPGETLARTRTIDRLQSDAPNALTPQELAALPRDPQKLRTYLRDIFATAGGAKPNDDELGVGLALDLLIQPGTPPDLQAAILAMLAADPSFVESSAPGSGTVTGEITLGALRHVLEMDAGTGRVRALREMTTQADQSQGLSAGDEIGHRRDFRYGFVDQPGQRP